MIYSNTNATDTNGLLVALKNFLAANGWTITLDGTGAGGLNLQVTNSAGHLFKLSTTSLTTTWFGQGLITDRRIHLDFDKAAIGLAAGFTGFEAFANDLTGPFPNIYFFTDNAATYVHVVAQCSADRYCHFSFGNLNPKGMHALPLPFLSGQYWQYWSDQVNFSNNNGGGNPFNYPSSTGHRMGHFIDEPLRTDDFAGFRLGLPNNLLDPAQGFDSGAIIQANVRKLCEREYFRTVNGNNSAHLLDFASTIKNHSFTGGVNLAPLPVQVLGSPDSSLTAYVGDIPNVCYVNMMGLSPGQILTFAGDEWMCFPMKQYGLVENCKFGASPVEKPNTAFYGFAYKKVGT